MHRIRQSIQFYGRVQGVGFRYKLGYLADKYSVTDGREMNMTDRFRQNCRGWKKILTRSYRHFTMTGI